MKEEIIKSNIPKTSVRVISKRLSPISQSIAPHHHDELEFLIVYSGLFRYEVYGKEYIMKAGDVVFVNPGVPHATSAIEESVTTCLQFKQTNFIDADVAKIIKYSIKLSNLSEEPIKVMHSPELFKTVNEIAEEFEAKETAYEFYIKSNIYRIMGFLYREGILSDTQKLYNAKEMQKILPALTYINENYYDDVTLAQMSTRLNFDPSYFCRIFKVALGTTFTEYLNFVRICKAEKLLSETEDSIIEISEKVGFSSVSYFNRIFKRFLNCTPKYYRATKYKTNN